MSLDRSIKCCATTKKGTPCKRNAEFDDLCGDHFDTKLRTKGASTHKCKVDGCVSFADVCFNGFCVDHWITIGISERIEREAPAASTGVKSSAAVIDAFRVLEMEPTEDSEAIKAKFRELVKRPDIRIAFTSTEVNSATIQARTKFEKIQTAMELLKSMGKV